MGISPEKISSVDVLTIRILSSRWNRYTAGSTGHTTKPKDLRNLLMSRYHLRPMDLSPDELRDVFSRWRVGYLDHMIILLEPPQVVVVVVWRHSNDRTLMFFLKDVLEAIDHVNHGKHQVEDSRQRHAYVSYNRYHPMVGDQEWSNQFLFLAYCR